MVGGVHLAAEPALEEGAGHALAHRDAGDAGAEGHDLARAVGERHQIGRAAPRA